MLSRPACSTEYNKCVIYNLTIAFCDSVDVVLRCPKTLGPVGLVGVSEVSFLLAPRASGFKCLMWRAATYMADFILP